ncbi:MAG TPA: adenylate/guanylate cyclase domain-containing protein [Acidimicrobiales bacterium]|nr:adenylate/guanylate cyclase domain-containing protein [Acidimicrobiales bacterium]
MTADVASPAPAWTGLEGERKQLTVLFADVQGSMDLQEKLDPEVWAGIMGRFVQILAEEIRRSGGTVDKFTGDGIMALFGAPVAQEDHARRACHAAWHLTTAVAAYAEDLRSSLGVDFHVRLGLNSGEVVVGRVGKDVRLDPTALGYTVGLAQRMEALAEPGRVYLTEHTAHLVKGWFHLTELGPTTVKGARKPLQVFVLDGPRRSLTTSGGDRVLGRSPLVGRQREMAALEDALAAATEGRAQIVGLVGEAGVGKSRLCEEFARSTTARGITVRRTTGVSHGREVPLLPILGLLRDYFSIIDEDDPGQAREKIARHLFDLDPALEGTLPLLYDFLEVPYPGRLTAQLTPEARMRRIFQALYRITQQRSDREVLVLVVEDLHWFDPQSEIFLERLVEFFSGSKTLVVANFRPEFSAGWMSHSYYRQVPLAPLPGKAVGEMLGGLLGVDLSLAPLVGFVQERTGGNPFFLEEIVRALVEDGTLAGSAGSYRLTRPLHEVKVPPSVQAVLAARIDRLPIERKAILQTAAVIGRTFAEPILATVTASAHEALQEALRALCAAEFLQEEGNPPVVEFRFWHPLTQEVAYRNLLSDRRARLHAAVAKALVEHDPDRSDEQAAVLAWHWERAGHKLEAARWNARAGTWALRSDITEARRRWRAAINLLKEIDEDAEGLELSVRAHIRLLQFGARTGIATDEADRLYAEGRVSADRLGDPGLRGMIVMASAAARTWSGDIAGGLVQAWEAAHLGDVADDPDVKAALWLGIPIAVSCGRGPLPLGLDRIKRLLTVCQGKLELGSVLMGYSPYVRALQLRAGILARMGSLEQARIDANEAIALSRSRGDLDTLCWALALLPHLTWLSGERDDVDAPAMEAARLGEETGNMAGLVLGLEGLALAHLVAGRPAEAITICEQALAEAREHRSGLFEEASLLAHMARARLKAGDPHGAVVSADEGVDVARRQGLTIVECLALLTRAQALRATGRSGADDDLMADLDTASVLATQTGALTYEPFIREERGRVRGDEPELREALRLFTVIEATGHARRLKAELDGSPLGPRASQPGG